MSYCSNGISSSQKNRVEGVLLDQDPPGACIIYQFKKIIIKKKKKK
jgi:hypothetical protein